MRHFFLLFFTFLLMLQSCNNAPNTTNQEVIKSTSISKPFKTLAEVKKLPLPFSCTDCGNRELTIKFSNGTEHVFEGKTSLSISRNGDISFGIGEVGGSLYGGRGLNLIGNTNSINYLEGGISTQLKLNGKPCQDSESNYGWDSSSSTIPRYFLRQGNLSINLDTNNNELVVNVNGIKSSNEAMFIAPWDGSCRLSTHSNEIIDGSIKELRIPIVFPKIELQGNKTSFNPNNENVEFKVIPNKSLNWIFRIYKLGTDSCLSNIPEIIKQETGSGEKTIVWNGRLTDGTILPESGYGVEVYYIDFIDSKENTIVNILSENLKLQTNKTTINPGNDETVDFNIISNKPDQWEFKLYKANSDKCLNLDEVLKTETGTGSKTILWDGKLPDGTILPKGSYFAQISYANCSEKDSVSVSIDYDIKQLFNGFEITPNGFYTKQEEQSTTINVSLKKKVPWDLKIEQVEKLSCIKDSQSYIYKFISNEKKTYTAEVISYGESVFNDKFEVVLPNEPTPTPMPSIPPTPSPTPEPTNTPTPSPTVTTTPNPSPTPTPTITPTPPSPTPTPPQPTPTSTPTPEPSPTPSSENDNLTMNYLIGFGNEKDYSNMGDFNFRITANSSVQEREALKYVEKTIGSSVKGIRHVLKLSSPIAFIFNELINARPTAIENLVNVNFDDCESKLITGAISIPELLNKSEDIYTNATVLIKRISNGQNVALWTVPLSKTQSFSIKWDGKYNTGTSSTDLIYLSSKF